QQYDMAKLIMDHILAVLNDSFTRTAFGCEYSHALSKNILSDPFMCLKILTSDFDAAIWFYCKIIKNPPHGWDRSSMTQVLLHLLNVRSNMGTLNSSKILDFFENIFDAVKTEKVSIHHENLLKALLLVCRILGADYRFRLCQLGESVMFPLMQLWKTRPSETCAELMLEFISFQLALHHPKSEASEEKGAHAHSWSLWKNHLLSLFKIFVQEIDELCEKNKYSSSKETILKPIFVSVFVEISAQVFVDGVGILDITQLPSTHDGTQPSKKRRVEVCFRTFMDALTSSKVIPWLQVISAYIFKYPESIPMEEAEHLLEVLIEINLSCNQFETKNWLLICFQSFVQSFGICTNEYLVESNFQWQRLWDLGVKSVALMNQCQEAAHLLLSTLLFHKLIVPKIEFLNLFTQGSSNKVTYASLRTLRIFLEKYSLSSVSSFHQSSLYGASSFTAVTFENQVLDWLFSRKSDDDSPFQVFSNDTDCRTIEEFAHVLILLCMKNTDFQSQNELVSNDLEKVKWISDLEEKLLEITFDSPMKHFDKIYRKDNSVKISTVVLCGPVWEKVLNFFIGVSSSIFEQQTLSNQLQMCMSSVFIKHASLLIEVLKVFFLQGIIKDADLNSNHFISYVKKFLNSTVELEMQKGDEKASKNSVLLFKEFLNNIIIIFKKIQQFASDPQSCHFIICIGNAIPTEILKDLLNFSLENFSEKKSLLNSSVSVPDQDLNWSHSLKKNKYAFSDDDSDIEMEHLDNSNTDADEAAFSVDLENISVDFQQQTQCLEILGEYCSFITSERYMERLDSFPEIMIKKLMPIITMKIQNLDDVRLVLISLKCILLNKYLEDTVIEAVIDTMKLLLNQYSIMQDLCIAVLKLFPLLFLHIIKSEENLSMKMKQNKSHMLHLIRVLCKREFNKKGSPLTSYLLAENIFTLLKMDSSISWPVLQGKSDQDESDVFNNAIACTFAQFLNSPYVAVRSFVADKIHHVISFELLDSIFDQACTGIFSFLENQECLDLDERMNKVSTFFHFMSNMILQYPCLQNEALFVMCKVVQTKKIDQSFVTKVFARLSSYLGFENTKNFIELHLSYIFHEWMKMKFSLEDFPFMILKAESFDAFIIEFFKILVPVLFHLEDLQSISKIAEKLQVSNSDLIYTCLPTIQAQIISGFSVGTRQKDSNKAKMLLNSMIPSEESEKAFLSKLDEFVVCLLKMLKDDQGYHLSRCQIKNVGSITSKDFSSTISFIMSSFEYKGSFISYLNKKGDCIQNIFLALNVMLSKALRPHEGRHILFMYKTFLELLCPELGPGLNCSCFVVKEIIYTIINFLANVRICTIQDEILVIYCCDILQLICYNAISYSKEIIGKLLPFVVSSLISFVEDTKYGEKDSYEGCNI
ncbi:serine-protein kinase ATM, partial [Nephila pilipes]